MRIFIDENVTVLRQVLAVNFPDHEFETSPSQKTSGMDDIALLQEIGSREFDAFITKDRNQWADLDERAAIRDSGVSWVAHRDLPFGGPQMVAYLGAAYLVALPIITERIVASGHPVYCRVRNIQHGVTERVKFLT